MYTVTWEAVIQWLIYQCFIYFKFVPWVIIKLLMSLKHFLIQCKIRHFSCPSSICPCKFVNVWHFVMYSVFSCYRQVNLNEKGMNTTEVINVMMLLLIYRKYCSFQIKMVVTQNIEFQHTDLCDKEVYAKQSMKLVEYISWHSWNFPNSLCVVPEIHVLF